MAIEPHALLKYIYLTESLPMYKFLIRHASFTSLVSHEDDTFIVAEIMYDSLTDEQALFVAFELIASQMRKNWHLLLFCSKIDALVA